MNKIMYVIAQLGHPNPAQYRFISTLAHEFKGHKEVLGYSDLKNALKWDSREIAEKHLEELPDWAKDKHRVHTVEETAFEWDYYRERPKVYKGFVLRPCNDCISYDILNADSWNLICIVGSLEKAMAWVDDWHRKWRSNKTANNCK